jgi:NTP pyrophosphatase (non-canonical NTP hydrolase)
MNRTKRRRSPQLSTIEESGATIGLDQFQSWTTLTDKNQRPGIAGIGFALLGIFGEVGSLLSELKKKQRDSNSYVAYHDSVIEEFGDVLWYLANAALRAGLRLSGVSRRIPAKLSDWNYEGRAAARSFADLQRRKRTFKGPRSSKLVERRLLALAGKVGTLLDDFSSRKIDDNRDALSGHLVEVLRTVLAAADDADVSLNEAARRNLLKTFGRWPIIPIYEPIFDEAYDQDEQLPRRIVMQFVETTVRGRKYVLQKCNGVNIGDRLTDNKLEPDDYRFHDVFHLAYAAILGWSPVLRALFRVKRKSNPDVDENQDGARAILIEEGIATWIFNHGVRHKNFENVTTLDYSLLKAIRELVTGYEVESRPLWQWERAVLEGWRIFREMKKHRGGIVTADLINHTIKFRAPK